MPATEQTWRNSKLLHVIFGLTALVMLLTTIWMLWADHAREWKEVQQTFSRVEAWMAQSRIDELETSKFKDEGKELDAALASAQAEVPPKELVEKFIATAETPPESSAEAAYELPDYDLTAVKNAYNALADAKAQKADQAQLIKLHKELIDSLDHVLRLATFEEGRLSRRLKDSRAKLDDVNSRYSLGVDEGLDAEELARRLQVAQQQQEVVHKALLNSQLATTHRKRIEAEINQIKADELAVQKEITKHQTTLKTLKEARTAAAVTSFSEGNSVLGIPLPGKSLLSLPIIDAFGSPYQIEQIWLPHLTLNNNFRDVARFDRCITCHKGIDKTAPGSAVKPGYPHLEPVTLLLETPEQRPELPQDATLNDSLAEVYGLKLADRGFIHAGDVTIDVVWPETPAARAAVESPADEWPKPSPGLRNGDIIEMIGDVKIRDHKLAQRYLLESVRWGQPIVMKVRRGLPHPFASHPRLDLFVGSLSPHKLGDMGCTICHDGQGQATAFKWASHSPNSPEIAHQWQREYGWFDNHHWILPMMPERFVESRCIKCHFEMSSLEPSEKFPDPPAPKLMKGYNLIREMGCFGCHEINGFDSPTKRRCPDLRTEPVYFAAAEQLMQVTKLDDEQRRMAEEVIVHPEQDGPRKKLAATILNAPAQEDGEPVYSAEARKLAGILGANDEMPGQYRKVGPSLRHVKSKVDFDFIYAWIRKPSDFRDSTKMPQFFGLWSHLTPEPKLTEHGKVVMVDPGLETSKKYEPIELRAISTYLLEASQPFEYLKPSPSVTEKPSAERGKQQFETRGCLACHQHPDFPAAKEDQGPNLAQLGAKLTGKRGRDWLYSWVRAPNRYHTRTVMPVLFLEPITQPDGKVTDPAADITAFLLGSKTPAARTHSHDSQLDPQAPEDQKELDKPWKPRNIPEFGDAESRQALDELTALYLSANFTHREVTDYVKHGIPESAGAIKGDDALLMVDGPVSDDELNHKKMIYVGRRTISRLGCSGCHDIPGFEDAKPIGTGLADWGRKETTKLAFEQIIPYLEQSQSFKHDLYHADQGQEKYGVEDDKPHGIEVKDLPPSVGFFVEAILDHKREGFLWQKLREPRSYDYRKTESKPYTDRLRMPLFTALDPADREAVMTFVLGLVSEPPAGRYVYQPDRRQGAIQKGNAILTKYNCVGCHTTRMEQWEFDYDPDAFPNPPEFTDYHFLKPYFTAKELSDSAKTDRRGMGHAVVSGMVNPEPIEDPDSGLPLWLFQLWQPVAINGHAWPVGSMDVPVLEKDITAKRPPHGGMLARLLHPVVLAEERKSNPNAKESDAWGWVPPPLVNEGRKVQSNWLHDFLLDPYPIRPAVVLRMPRFNMSSEEASALADYFAAVDDVDYPYEFDPRTRPDYLASEEAQTPNRLPGALKIVTDNNYCVKCHLVGDFTPQGSKAALAPQLSRVNERLRHEFVRDWIANPKRLLPYTGMPQNIPPDKPVSQDLLQGDSLQQLNAVVDLLLNWPTFMENKTSIAPLVKPAATAPAASVPATDSRAPKVSVRSSREAPEEPTTLAEGTRTPTARKGD